MNKIKRNIKHKMVLSFGACLLNIVLVPLSSIADELATFPALAPENCGIVVNVPKGSNENVLFDQQCNTVFIKPPKSGEVKVVNFSPSMSVISCYDYMQNFEIVTNLSAKKAALNLHLLDIESQAEENSPGRQNKINSIRDSINITQNQIELLNKTYSGIEAGSAVFSFSTGVSDEELQRWLEINKHLFMGPVTQKKYNVLRAPITKGWISFKPVDVKESDLLRNPAVLYSEIPGFRSNPNDGGNIRMGTKTTGLVKLSLAGLCPLIQIQPPSAQFDFKKVEIDKEKASAHLVANFTYAVNAISQISFEASLDVEETINYIVERVIRSKKYETEDVTRVESNSGEPTHSYMELCHVSFKSYSNDYSGMPDAIKTNFEEKLKSDICKGFVDRLALVMVKNNFLEVAKKNVEGAKALPGAEVPYYETRTDCVTNYLDVGLGVRIPLPYGQTCYPVTYVAGSTFHDGLSTVKTMITEKYKENFKTEYLISQPVELWDTAGFELKKIMPINQL